jgi:hypothetical protein
LKADVEGILASGVNHTGTFIELLKEKDWSEGVIVPLVYQLLLMGKLDPNGNKYPKND